MTITEDQAQPVLKPPSRYELRDMLEEMVMKDLLGPAGGPEEEINEARVRERYLVGMLAPKQLGLAQEEFDEIAKAGIDTHDEGKTDTGTIHANAFFPSSLGMTFSVGSDAIELKLTARWGRYERAPSETAVTKTGEPKTVWKRTPVESSLTLPLKEGDLSPLVVDEDQPGIIVTGRMRKHDEGWLITLFLVNEQEEPKQTKDVAWVFQPELTVESPDGRPIFQERMIRAVSERKLDPLTKTETEEFTMLYRHHVQFAVGHGTSVHAEVDPDKSDQAFRISTRVMPSYEVPIHISPGPADNPDLAGIVLDMKELSEMPRDDLAATLGILPDAYEKWIEREEAVIADPQSDLAAHAGPAKRAMDSCRRVLERIHEGIALLMRDDQALEAFRFANNAMWQQRVHSIYAREVNKKTEPKLEEIDVPKNRTWYPFQLVFILLNLPGVTDLHHTDRSVTADAVADLLWFPTGGGKTEAYLGLAAYTMAIRRLQGIIEGRSGEAGVAVLMRYTLRLLTLQQFQRAAALICACEMIRREDPEKWGQEPFRIGLWVGMRATPNNTEQAAQAILERRGGGYFASSVGTPAQLSYCPWCGTEIDPGKHIRPLPGMSNPIRTFMYCGDQLGRCPFSERNSPDEGIPALVVDDEIYRRLPALLIATVDKFAQMPWKGQVQMLFGQVNGYCPRHGFRSPEIEDADSHRKAGKLPAVKSVPHNPLRPPDLIIQDELHLISGPLGSLVGLYETAVDQLATWTVDGKAVRPKVVASTATIRRAQDQVNDLYWRKVEVFPPHGTDIADSFFSEQRGPSGEYPGRRYLGVCASGKRYPAALIRAYVALMGAAQKLYEQYDTSADPWMTLVGYFNSLRQLGGMRRLVEDDVSARLNEADKRGLGKRRRPYLEELTSRKSGVDIPIILNQLDIPFSHELDKRREEQRKASKRVERRPLDVVLATNMISVGVDVNRLGLMVVAGQPKTTAEYIQATSRVGRQFPGLVVTVLHWARPRDMSHYEVFEHYHATFYKHVEALSVTPFAQRALDRGLSALLVSLVRLSSDRLNENQRAGSLEANDELLLGAFEEIVNRAANVTHNKDVGISIREMLEDRRDHWLNEIRRSTTSTRLGYRTKRDGVTVGLLRTAEVGPWEKFTCLNSLRDVEPTVNLLLSPSYSLGPRSQAGDTEEGEI